MKQVKYLKKILRLNIIRKVKEENILKFFLKLNCIKKRKFIIRTKNRSSQIINYVK